MAQIHQLDYIFCNTEDNMQLAEEASL